MLPRPVFSGSTATLVAVLLVLASFGATTPAMAQAGCGGFNLGGIGGFNFGGGFGGGFNGGFNNFGNGGLQTGFQGGFQGFQFSQGFNNFGGGGFQTGFQGGFQGFNLGGFNFGVGGFQGGFNNFGGGGLNVNLGVAPFGFNFGGLTGCAAGTFGLIPDGATVTVGDAFQYRLVWVSPTNWQGLEYLDLRLRDANGVVYAIIRWVQGTDRYQLIDPTSGAVVAQGPSRGGSVLEGPNVSVVLADSYSDDSGPTGQAVGLNVTIVPKAPLTDKFLGVDVGAKSDAAPPGAYELAALLNVVGPTVQNPANNDDEKEDKGRKLTEEQRQQRSRTDRSNIDDIRTEGNAVATNCDAPIPTVTIANRDGDVVLNLLYDAKESCRLVQAGDYVEAVGEKQHEYLYDAHQLTVRRHGSRVR